MTYTIESHGDVYERQFHPYLSTLFPHYEKFWASIVVPFTMRDINGGISLRPGVHRYLELLAMSHYSCYYHLGIAHDLLQSANDRAYLNDDFFLHMETAVAMAERVLIYCDKIWTELFATPKGYFLSIRRTDDWKAKKTSFDALSNEVSLYRNAMAHDPKLGQVVAVADGTVWIPHYSKLPRDNPPTWSEITPFRFPDEFVQLSSLIDRLKAEIPRAIDVLWPELISELTQLSQSNDRYQQMACIGKYQPVQTVPVVTSVVGIPYASNLPTSASGISLDSSGSAQSHR